MSEKLWKGQKKSARLQLSIEGRRNSIRVYKDVVRVLGAPSYISIRINKEMNSILLEGAKEKNKLSFKVADDYYLDNAKRMVIQSAAFVSGLMLYNNLNPEETYQVEGIYSEKNNAVIFELRDAKLFRSARRCS